MRDHRSGLLLDMPALIERGLIDRHPNDVPPDEHDDGAVRRVSGAADRRGGSWLLVFVGDALEELTGGR